MVYLDKAALDAAMEEANHLTAAGGIPANEYVAGIITAYLAALKAQEPAVKALEWVATGQTGFLECQHYAVSGTLRHTVHPLESEDGPFFEHYDIRHDQNTDRWKLCYWVGNNGLSGVRDDFATLEAAKAAAQADYETRIRSALVTTPQPQLPPDRAGLDSLLIHLRGCLSRQNSDGAIEVPASYITEAIAALSQPVAIPQAQAGHLVIEAKEHEAFDKADWFWRTMDPDDSGDTPSEALCRGGVPNFVVCEIESSYAGPTRYGFTAPTTDPDSDEEQFLHFATEAEAVAAAMQLRPAAPQDGQEGA